MTEVAPWSTTGERASVRTAFWRRIAAGATAAGAVCFAVPAWAQGERSTAESATRPESASVSGHQPHAVGTPLPSSIPVRRDSATSEDADFGGRWWALLLPVGGLLLYGVMVGRRKQASQGAGHGQAVPGNAAASWLRLGGWIDKVSSTEIQRVASTRLSPRHSLHVVVWDGKRLLLGCTDQSIQVLSQGSVHEPVSPPTAGEVER